MRLWLQIAFGCNETGVTGVAGETTAQPKPSSRELHPIGAELEYQLSELRVEELWERPVTSGASYRLEWDNQTAATQR